ncbi:iron-containing alcohol dehydrogenase [Williamsia herbipolensis]|uniref:Iron-containing alcohol dehydrogenase n=1 Tax=Williamsia herbipolensis TaxID=1603258 RepID=A0AAU4K0Z8_9NOCA|nr:daptide-type RiPP biosynthesis dehydogenase [Williamsia herbipolensis]
MLTTTPVLHGLASLQTLLRDPTASRDPGARAIVAVDPALVGSAALAELTSLLTWCAIDHEIVPTPPVVDLDAVRGAAATLGRASQVLSLGGGSTLDLVKIGLHLGAVPGLGDHLARCGRAGLIHLGDDAPNRPRHIAIPTTLGTGAERSPRACLSLDGHKRLLVGGGLAPDAAVLDERATRDLPHHLVTFGAAEAFLRLAGVLTGDVAAWADGLEDRLSLELLAHTVEHADRAAAAQGPVSGDVRLALAKASAWSQAPEFHRVGRDPFAAKGWYIANELSTATGATKVSAFGGVTAALWARLQAGDLRLGSPQRLRLVWDRVRDASPGLPHAPADGLRILLDRWGVAPLDPMTASQTEAVAAACDRRWGRGQPALGGFTRSELADIVTDAAPGVGASACAVDLAVGAVS